MPKAGTVIAIGGGEDKEGSREILQRVAAKLKGGPLVVATIASREPEGYVEVYRKAFRELGVTSLRELHVDDRCESAAPEKLKVFDGAAGVFFTGGDQLRITSQIGDTPIEERVRQLHQRGGLVAGTSAGASMMSETMLVSGASEDTYRVGHLHMAPGLCLVPDTIIDQHFAERGRIGRLLVGVGYNPRMLGIGIDEDTCIVIDGGKFEVAGCGAVYIVDGSGITHANVAEASPNTALSLYDVRLHVLSRGDVFQLTDRAPVHPAQHNRAPEKPGPAQRKKRK